MQAREEVAMSFVLWIAVALMLAGALFLVVGMGSSGLWIAAIAVGIALVAIERSRSHRKVAS
jgi:predicted O-methyltransferase YrrM